MVKHDDKTPRGWPLPHQDNRLYDDVERLREALRLIDAIITAIEGEQGSLGLRLDTILEGATEDAEILDARIDAEDTVHPNLGHNIRNLHRLILGLEESLNYESLEFRGLLQQFSSVAEAQIQEELNAQEAHERRKREIQQEASIRSEHDDGIQKQMNAAADGMMRLAFALQDLSKKRRETSKHEESERVSEDGHLQAEINALAESCLRDTLNLYNAIERWKSALK